MKSPRHIIKVPNSSYDVDEGFPELLETDEEFEWSSNITLSSGDVVEVVLRFVPDQFGTQYLTEVSDGH